MIQANDDVIQTATEWYVTLSSGEATDLQVKAWKSWLNAHPKHMQAWQKLETITQQFSTLDASSSMAVLSKSNQIKTQTSALASHGRRQALKHFTVLLGVGSLGWLTYKQQPWLPLMADYVTDTGKQQQFTLEDGTALFLNTDTLVAIDYTNKERNINLIKGEILIETAHEKSAIYRPLSVITKQGKLTALGTRFGVRINDANSDEPYNDINVYEGAVSVKSKSNTKAVIVNAGEYMRFSATQYQEKEALDTSSDAWIHGFIVVDKMPLKIFVTELSRYKAGIITCEPSISQLEISGAYPLNDIETTLTSISKTLNLRIETFTRYWVTLKPS